MRYKNIKPTNINDCLMFGDNAMTGDFEIEATDELIEITNTLRKRKGYTDLVKVGEENDVYYNFYLIFDMNIKFISIQAVCNHGEKDDWETYDLPTTNLEKELLLFKLVEWLLNIVYEN